MRYTVRSPSAELRTPSACPVLNCALIGCGRVAPRHAESIAESPDVQLVAVADVVESRAERFAGTYGARAFTDYRRVLDRPDVDLVHIATPSGLHARMTIDALQAGKHVLVEKPIALTLTDADEMIATAERFGRKLGVVMQNRFNPPMRDLRRAVDDGRLGRLILGNATVRWYRPQQYYEDGWHGTWAMDGGALMNQSIHHIDALQWFLGDADSVFSYTATLAHRMEAEDTGVAAIRFASGAIGSVEGSTVTYPENLEGSVALFGTRGSVKVGGTALNRKEIWKIDGELDHEERVLAEARSNPISVYGSSHATVIAGMARAIRDDVEVPTTGEDARKPLALVLAMYESSRTGQPVDLTQARWRAGAGPARTLGSPPAMLTGR